MKNVNPNPKVVASTTAAGAVGIIIWLGSLLGVDVPVEVAGALVVIATAVAGYVKSAGAWAPKA